MQISLRKTNAISETGQLDSFVQSNKIYVLSLPVSLHSVVSISFLNFLSGRYEDYLEILFLPQPHK